MGQNGQTGQGGGGTTPGGATDMYGRQGATPTAPGGAGQPAAQKPQASSYPYSTQQQYGASAGYSHTQQPQDAASGAYGQRAYGQTLSHTSQSMLP